MAGFSAGKRVMMRIHVDQLKELWSAVCSNEQNILKTEWGGMNDQGRDRTNAITSMIFMSDHQMAT